jgi:hypothetical protein
VDLFRINFAVLTFIAKVEDAKDMKLLRPIILLNYSFKIFSKMLTLRLEKVSQRLILKEQSAFIHVRYILESVVVVHEIVQSIHRSKTPSVILKLDYEKAYDKVNIDFLIEILKLRGFGDRWIGWIKQIVCGGSVSVGANGEETSPFKTRQGLRQGDPLFPFLFNLVADVLTKMLDKTAKEKLTVGLLDQFRSGGVVSLQYADDTLLFSNYDTGAIRNLKCVLMLFEQVSRMRINFHKSEWVPTNLDDEQIHEIAHVLSCPVGKFPIKYLGVPLHFEKLKREDLQPVVDKLSKRCARWRGKLLAYSSRLTLVKTCMASIVYLLSFIKFPK